ncbi:THO complex subunit 4D-like isoform X1 [Canna indica]|uniref:THO complex subunit 4D-like isoform X1 n=1 Tax=Canna indica TaxID=4628 RepID=A0AAQ3KRM7_9LILI|nr:THO complex subunit 4D-like isoform X1 [Canna indica]
MATSLDMSLDDLIKNRTSNQRGRGRGRGQGQGRRRGRGGTFRGRGMGVQHGGPLRVNNHPSAYKIAKSFSRTKGMIWRHDLFDDSIVAAGMSGVETGTKLYVSNLDYGVSNEDIRELFSEVGALKRFAVHYDRNGRPSGSAEVVYTRRSDALAALKRYNNVQLDGKPMNIEVIGTNLGLPITPRVNVVGGPNGRGKRTVVMTPQVGRGGSSSFNRASGIARSGPHGFQRGRGRARGGGRSRGRGRGRKQNVEKSAVDLDKELETYHAEAMNTS